MLLGFERRRRLRDPVSHNTAMKLPTGILCVSLVPITSSYFFFVQYTPKLLESVLRLDLVPASLRFSPSCCAWSIRSSTRDASDSE